jgi:hypothetical protein
MFGRRSQKLREVREKFIKYMDSSMYINIENDTLKSYGTIAEECAGSKLYHHKIRQMMAQLYPAIADRLSRKGHFKAMQQTKRDLANKAAKVQAEEDKRTAEKDRLNSLVSVGQLEQVLKGVKGITRLPLLLTPDVVEAINSLPSE